MACSGLPWHLLPSTTPESCREGAVQDPQAGQRFQPRISTCCFGETPVRWDSATVPMDFLNVGPQRRRGAAEAILEKFRWTVTYKFNVRDFLLTRRARSSKKNKTFKNGAPKNKTFKNGGPKLEETRTRSETR